MFDLLKQSNNLRQIVLANLFSSFGRGMVLIGISWYMVEESGQAGPLGITMLISTLLMIIIGPNLGIVIDKFSRKRILITENVFGSLVLFIFSILFLNIDQISIITLTIIYIISMLISQIHFPTQSALVQELFDSSEYQEVNSTLEVQNQVAQVLAGALAGLLLTNFSLTVVLLITSITYFIAFIFLLFVKYEFNNADVEITSNKLGWVKKLTYGLKFVCKKKNFLVFGMSVFVPFIILMVGNLLAPVYVSLDINESVTIFSMGELAYALGAVFAGLLVIVILKRVSQKGFLVVNILIFATLLTIMVIWGQGWFFILTYFYLGWTVASTRLVSQTIFMNIVPKYIMGRVLTALDMLALIVRVILLITFTIILDFLSAGIGYLLLSVISIIAAVGIFISFNKVHTEKNEFYNNSPLQNKDFKA
ncbi:Major Facilitator Superfamily protein [Evansella caseinilytica]|uniref:Major Facilitator Superfamily protein n=1 Tax=Evansella caseinilytica TaxID=1503961 RepID=A0A1H3LAZ2_9BACI|nr:MFS transporter [Evansella caseinilytica]SDY61466.1 Major Facilitator Superfamily protein [Evansella caseinilytica]